MHSFESVLSLHVWCCCTRSRSDSAIARQSLLRELSLRYVFHLPTFRPLQRATTTVKIKAESEGLGGLIAADPQATASCRRSSTRMQAAHSGPQPLCPWLQMSWLMNRHTSGRSDLNLSLSSSLQHSFHRSKKNWLRLPHLTNKNCQQWRPFENEHEPVKTIQPV